MPKKQTVRLPEQPTNADIEALDKEPESVGCDIPGGLDEDEEMADFVDLKPEDTIEHSDSHSDEDDNLPIRLRKTIKQPVVHQDSEEEDEDEDQDPDFKDPDSQSEEEMGDPSKPAPTLTNEAKPEAKPREKVDAKAAKPAPTLTNEAKPEAKPREKVDAKAVKPAPTLTNEAKPEAKPREKVDAKAAKPAPTLTNEAKPEAKPREKVDDMPQAGDIKAKNKPLVSGQADPERAPTTSQKAKASHEDLVNQLQAAQALIAEMEARQELGKPIVKSDVKPDVDAKPNAKPDAEMEEASDEGEAVSMDITSDGMGAPSGDGDGTATSGVLFFNEVSVAKNGLFEIRVDPHMEVLGFNTTVQDGGFAGTTPSVLQDSPESDFTDISALAWYQADVQIKGGVAMQRICQASTLTVKVTPSKKDPSNVEKAAYQINKDSGVVCTCTPVTWLMACSLANS